MRVAYYFEPWLELGRPYLRYHNFRHQMGPQIRALVRAGVTVDVFIGDTTWQKCREDGYQGDGARIHVIAQQELTEIFPDYCSATVSLARDTASAAQKAAMGQLLKDKLQGAVPDVFISFLSPVPFVSEMWPETLVLYTEFGLFSRAPYPRSFYFDRFGLFNQSYLGRYGQELRKRPVTAAAIARLNDFRLRTQAPLVASAPDKREIGASKFRHTLLLPLQFSNYFGFDAYCRFKSQFEFLEHALSQIPDDIGVIVTEHSGWPEVVTEHNRDYLSNRYPNALLADNFRHIQNPSQVLLHMADGVVSVSSSVGLQALFLGKPVFALGDTHLTPFSAGELSQADRVIQSYDSSPNDAAINHLIESYYPTERYCYDAQWFVGFLRRSLERFRANTPAIDFYSSIAAPEAVYRHLAEDCRAESFTAQTNKSRTAPQANTATTQPDDPRLEAIAAQMRLHKAVSFDIFDTLVERPLAAPHQLFLLMQPEVRRLTGKPNLDFHKLRRYAEHLARMDSPLPEVTIEEIYDRLAVESGIERSRLDPVIELEIKTELSLCRARPIGAKLFNLARNHCPRVVLTSDIYLPAAVIEQLLASCGYSGWDRLFVSADLRLTKKTGELFPHVVKELDVTPKELLHIGDNKDSDVTLPASMGISCVHLHKATEMFFGNAAHKPLWAHEDKRVVYPTEGAHLASATLIGLTANRLFGDPVGVNLNSAYDGDPRKLGYCVFGPMLLGFTLDLCQRIALANADSVQFLSRDGYLLKRCYDVVRQQVPGLPPSNYLLASRRALGVATLRTDEDVLAALETPFKPCSIEHLLKNRFGLEDPAALINDEILADAGFDSLDEEVHPVHQLLKLQKLVTALCPAILANAAVERAAATAYYGGELNKFQRPLLVDIGYTGSAQEALAKLLDRFLAGHYVITHLRARELSRRMPIEGYLGRFVDHTDPRSTFFQRVTVLESLCGAAEASLKRFALGEDGQVRALFQPQAPASSMRDITVTLIQDGAVSFSADVADALGADITRLEISADLAARAYLDYLNKPLGADAVIFNGMDIEDSYGGHAKRYVVADVVGASLRQDGKISADEAKALIDASDWKSAVRALLPASDPKQLGQLDKPRRYALDLSRLANYKGGASNVLSLPVAPGLVGANGDHPSWAVLRRRLAKLRRNPDLFFADSRTPLVQGIGRIYRMVGKR